MRGRSCMRAGAGGCGGGGRGALVVAGSQSLTAGREGAYARMHQRRARCPGREQKAGGSWLTGERGAHATGSERATRRCLLWRRARGACLRKRGGASRAVYTGGVEGNGAGHALGLWLASMQTRCSPQPPAGEVCQLGLCDPGAELRWASHGYFWELLMRVLVLTCR
jgi:hypothetical protein